MLASLCLATGLSSAQTLRYSADTSLSLASTFVSEGEIAVEDVGGNVNTEQLPFDPSPAEITAYHRISTGEFLVVLDTTVTAGSATFRSGEVLHAVADSVFSAFDPVTAGLPRGTRIDAVTQNNGNLVISFDTDVNWNGSFFADEDLVEFDGSTPSMALDGSSNGIVSSADIDAAHRTGDNRWAVSFDAPGELGGIRYRDQDVVAVDPGTGSWSLAYDASAGVSGWGDAGLDAIWLAPPSPSDQVQWTQSAVTVSEAVSQVTITIERSGSADGIVSVEWEAVGGGSADVPDDFYGKSGFAAMGDGVMSKQLTVTVVDDSEVEGAEEFYVDLVSVASGDETLGSPTRVTVTIEDNDSAGDAVFADRFEASP